MQYLLSSLDPGGCLVTTRHSTPADAAREITRRILAGHTRFHLEYCEEGVTYA